jgi:hypothetical protein
MIASVMRPGSFTAIPSAIVLTPHSIGSPRSACSMEGKRAVSMPTTSMSFRMPLAATAFPEIRPPPPMGMSRVSRSGCSLSISSAIVPCPAMIWGSS